MADWLQQQLAGPSPVGLEDGSDEEPEFAEDDFIDEEDYVHEVLRKQRALADIVAPEDAFISSLPPKVQEKLFDNLPPPPPRRDDDRPRYSSTSTITAPTKAKDPPPDIPTTMGMPGERRAEAESPPGQEATSPMPSLSQVSNFRFDLDALLCGGGSSFGFAGSSHAKLFAAENGVDDDAGSNPWEFDPVGGALAVELNSVTGLIRVSGECDPFVSCALIGANGAPLGSPAVWPRKRDTTNPRWNSTRFVGPPGYVCAPGDRLEFSVFQTVGAIVGVATGATGGGSPQLVGVAHVANVDQFKPQPGTSQGPAEGARESMVPVQRCLAHLKAWRLGAEAGALFSGGLLLGVLERDKELLGRNAEAAKCELTFRVVLPPPCRKRVFFIRHGQSEWNRATEETYDVRGMLALDHPLSDKGVGEANELKQAIDAAVAAGPGASSQHMLEMNEFLSAAAVISSPLTRALQTAMVALRDHPTVRRQRKVRRRGITLLSDARELKTAVGLDTMSEHRGLRILERARTRLKRSPMLNAVATTKKNKEQQQQQRQGQLEEEEKSGDWLAWVKSTDPFSPAAAHPARAVEASELPSKALRTIASIQVNCADAEDHWWDVYEAPEEKRAHVARLMTALRMAPHKTNIVVGHSLCFKALMGAYASRADSGGVDPKFWSNKLMNCGVMVVDLDFGYAAEELAHSDQTENSAQAGVGKGLLSVGDNGYKPIRTAKLMFGSTFHGE